MIPCSFNFLIHGISTDLLDVFSCSNLTQYLEIAGKFRIHVCNSYSASTMLAFFRWNSAKKRECIFFFLTNRTTIYFLSHIFKNMRFLRFWIKLSLVFCLFVCLFVFLNLQLAGLIVFSKILWRFVCLNVIYLLQLISGMRSLLIFLYRIIFRVTLISHERHLLLRTYNPFLKSFVIIDCMSN